MTSKRECAAPVPRVAQHLTSRLQTIVSTVFRGVWYISNIMWCFLQQQDAAFDHDDNECLRLLDALLEPLQIVTAASYKNSCEMKYVRMSWTASKWRKSLVAHGRISHRICEFVLRASKKPQATVAAASLPRLERTDKLAKFREWICSNQMQRAHFKWIDTTEHNSWDGLADCVQIVQGTKGTEPLGNLPDHHELPAGHRQWPMSLILQSEVVNPW